MQAPPETIYQYVADVKNASLPDQRLHRSASGPEPPGPPAVGQRYRVRGFLPGQQRYPGIAPGPPGAGPPGATGAQPGPASDTITITLRPTKGGRATHVEARLPAHPAFNNLMLGMVMGSVLEQALHRLQRTLEPSGE